jgi:glycogen debranching enzyme GlgX
VSGLGAQSDRQGGVDGVRFAVWAPQAEGVDVCLFDTATGPQTRRLSLAPAGNGVWQTFVPGLQAGQLYGLRAHGPWQPEAGLRFNPQRLLLDPWALALVGDTTRLALQTGHAVADPLHPVQPWHEHRPAPDDNAGQIPKCVVVDAAAELSAGAAIATRPTIAEHRRVLYEAHVKALTRRHPEVPEDQRGTYAALAHPAVMAHLQRLGITSVCLLPVHQHISERHLLARGLVNHWGYNTLNAFAPEPGYAAATGGADAQTAGQAAAVRAEFRTMVDALHRSGIEVVLDVVFNHTAESDLDGPTLSWRGLDQNHWYAMGDRGVPHNFSGTGNSLATGQPRVIQWVMDSLRWWVQAYGVDGFRFDLAVSLGRSAAQGQAFHPHAPLLAAMQQDPVLREVALIAEPWDIGPHGYHAGGFAPGWLEWNDAFRDGQRAFWLGHQPSIGELARRTCASSDRFQQGGRLPTASVNLITAHDGFNLADLTAYSHKHNEANGEDNRDGHDHNLSANGGAEGGTDDAQVTQRRALWRRALLASLFCAQGTPQLLAGDEIGHSQQGNNNVYCQDNPITWLDWAGADQGLCAFVAALAALRRRHPGLRHPVWFRGEPLAGSTLPDIVWLQADGRALQASDWAHCPQGSLGALIAVGEGGRAPTERLLLIWHNGQAPVRFGLPPGPWSLWLDSARAFVAADTRTAEAVHGDLMDLQDTRVCLLVQTLHADGQPPNTPT